MQRTVYGIRSVVGELIAEHVRVDWPDGKKRMYWQRPDRDPRDGLGGLGTADLPLYGSERMGLMQMGRTPIIVEGERATDALRGLYSWVYGTVTGASGTPGEDALAPLLSDDVVLWPDHDEPGERHMERIAASIIRLGGRCRRLVWTGARSKGDDAADFIARGGQRVVLDLLLRDAAPWQIAAPATRVAVRPSYDRHEDAGRVDAARSHLVEVVEARLGPPRKRAGRSLLWCCPFHSERTPSFKVDTKEPFFRCFGCGERGDVFAFLARMEGVCFKDALRELAPPRLLGAAIPW